MSDERANITGSAAREHEATAGNVKAGQSNLPAAGSAALAAETAAQEAHGVEARPRYRGTDSMSLPLVRGARMVAAAEPEPDFSQRTAADYLPAHLKAQLIAEGKLTVAGELVTTVTPAAPAPEPTPAVTIAATSNPGAETAEPANWAAKLVGRLRNLFSE